MGIALALLAYSLLAFQDAGVKWLVATVPVHQVLFIRSVIVLGLCLARGSGATLGRAIHSPRRGLLLLRSGITLAAWLCYFTAAKTLPLAQLLTLYFTAPVIVTLLAFRFLGERVTRARWAAVALGFAGTVAAVSPTGFAASAASGLVLAGAALWACGVILTRRIARTEPSLVQMLFVNAFFFAATGAASLSDWHSPTATEWAVLLGVAVLGGLGQLSLFESARRIPASVTAPLEYTALVWAFVLGYAVWGDVPAPPVFIGAGLILSAGAGLFIAERKNRPGAIP